MSDTNKTIMSSVEVNVPTWMDEDTCDVVKKTMSDICEFLTKNNPGGINGVAASYAMMNIMIATLGSAFRSGGSDSMKANVLLVAVSLDDLLTNAIDEMHKHVSPDVLRLITETEGNA